MAGPTEELKIGFCDSASLANWDKVVMSLSALSAFLTGPSFRDGSFCDTLANFMSGILIPTSEVGAFVAPLFSPPS
jgi:hypothetical protein